MAALDSFLLVNVGFDKRTSMCQCAERLDLAPAHFTSAARAKMFKNEVREEATQSEISRKRRVESTSQ